MKIVKSEHTVFIDVDDTLVMHVDPDTIKGVKVQVYDSVGEGFITVEANLPMIRLLKEEKHRGAYIVVWSRGGYEWASNVIRALELVSYVDEVMSKPMVYFDDKSIAEWLPYRVWLPPETVYKNKRGQNDCH